MKIIDLHCDALMKLNDANGALSFTNAVELDTNYERLVNGNILVQAFAIFIPPEIEPTQKFQEALYQIYYFYHEVLDRHPKMKQIKDWTDIKRLQNGEIGAMLTLEGVDVIGNDLKKLKILYELGVRSIGLTWNHANLAASGVDGRQANGLTTFGREIIRMNNKHRVFTDVSHLNEASFWDVIEEGRYIIASHSNAKTICNHQRNVTDTQAKALFAKDCMIHLVYNPPFVKEKGHATIADLITHIDHFCALGGVENIGLGSDFDGIEDKVIQLENASMQVNLINELLKHFSEDEVKGFAHQNFLNHLPK